MGIENAKVLGVEILIEPNTNGLTCNIYLEGANWNATFGGLLLKQDSELHTPDQTGWFLRRVFETFGVTTTKQMFGMPCRVQIDSQGQLVAVGNFLNDNWFDIKQELQ